MTGRRGGGRGLEKDAKTGIVSETTYSTDQLYDVENAGVRCRAKNQGGIDFGGIRSGAGHGICARWEN